MNSEPSISAPISLIPTVGDKFWSKRTGLCYELKSVVSGGGFGIVYSGVSLARHRTSDIAVKIEKWDKSMQSNEVAVLKTARKYDCKHFPELIDYGSTNKKFYFIVMTLLGKDLYRLRKEQPQNTFSLSTAIRVGYQTMQAIEELHTKCRYICRDIKPSNFVISQITTPFRICIIDFGLCRRYIDQKGNIVPSRGEIGWRGTSRYASLQCHLKMDLSRKDDLESWFYMLIEATAGQVPWQREKARDIVYSMKLKARASKRHDFLSNCPIEYNHILKKIDLMEFPDAPDYKFIYAILNMISTKQNIKNADLYDWEKEQHFAATEPSQYNHLIINSQIEQDKLEL